MLCLLHHSSERSTDHAARPELDCCLPCIHCAGILVRLLLFLRSGYWHSLFTLVQ